MAQLVHTSGGTSRDGRVLDALMTKIAERIDRAEKRDGLTNGASWRLTAAEAAARGDARHLAVIADELAAYWSKSEARRGLIDAFAALLKPVGVVLAVVGFFTFLTIDKQRVEAELKAKHEREEAAYQDRMAAYRAALGLK